VVDVPGLDGAERKLQYYNGTYFYTAGNLTYFFVSGDTTDTTGGEDTQPPTDDEQCGNVGAAEGEVLLCTEMLSYFHPCKHTGTSAAVAQRCVSYLNSCKHTRTCAAVHTEGVIRYTPCRSTRMCAAVCARAHTNIHQIYPLQVHA